MQAEEIGVEPSLWA